MFQGELKHPGDHRKDQWAGSKAVCVSQFRVCHIAVSGCHSLGYWELVFLWRLRKDMIQDCGQSDPAVVCRRHQSREEVVSVVFLSL